RREFKPAVDAWLATKPLQNRNAPLTPFAMPQYRVSATAEAESLDAQAETSAAIGRRYIQRSTNYVLAVVLFAASLFFAGISTKLGGERTRIFTLAVGWVIFVGTLVWVATSPVSVSL